MAMTDTELILQKSINTSLRFQLLDDTKTITGQLQGYVIRGNVSINASSAIRRTASITMYVPDKDYLTSKFETFWIDKMVWVYIGVYDFTISDYKWWHLGSFLFSDINYSYDATSQELSINLVDMMSAATESRGSQIGSSVWIPYDQNTRNALIATIAAFSPFKYYSVIEFPTTIPQDLEFDPGIYPITILESILNLYTFYEQFYSIDGVYTVQGIPTGIGDSVLISETLMDKVFITDKGGRKLSDIKNSTEVWGRELDAGYTASSCTNISSTYNLTFSTALETIEANSTYSFTPDINSSSGHYIKIDDLDAYPIYVQAGDGSEQIIGENEIEADRQYVVKFVEDKFYLQGESIIHVIVKEVSEMPDAEDIALDKLTNDCRDIEYVVNADSPFAVDKIGEIKQVKKDGDYSAIYTTQLALERAAYENWLTTRLQDSITLECLLIPWIDVNKKIAYTSPTGVVGQYMVQSVDMDLSAFTMSVKCIQFYPAYPWL